MIVPKVSIPPVPAKPWALHCPLSMLNSDWDELGLSQCQLLVLFVAQLVSKMLIRKMLVVFMCSPNLIA